MAPVGPPARSPADRGPLRELAEGDAKFLRDLVETFAADARERLAELRAASARGDAAACVGPCHALKGTVATFEAGAAAAAVDALERCVRSGAVGGLAAACAEVEREVEGLLRELRELAASA